MKKRPLTTRSLWIYYYKYRETLVFSGVIFLSVTVISALLIWALILPQLRQWFSIRQEVVAAQERIRTIQSNSAIASQIDDTALTNDLETVAAAYLSQKDYIGILTAVSDAAGRSNVSLADFSFQVGELATKSAGFKVEPIIVELSLLSETTEVIRFVQEIQKKMPLSEIKGLESSGETKSLTLEFPFQPFPALEFKDSEPLRVLDAKERELINTLTEWKDARPLTQ